MRVAGVRARVQLRLVDAPRYLDHEQPLLLLSVALQETVLGTLQALPGVLQAGQSLQSSVAPHDVQLQDSKVVHAPEQRRATLAGNTHHIGVNAVEPRAPTGRTATHLK